MTRVTKAVIPAAGLGTRFYPLTRAQPKEMLPLVDRPVIHYVVEEALKSGLDEILIIVGAGKDSIINYFDRHNLDKDSDFDFPDIYFVRQKQLLGLGDSIRHAKKFTNGEPFSILLGDTVYVSGDDRTVTQQMLDIYNRKGKPVISLERVSDEKVGNYGMVNGEPQSDGTLRISEMIEKPSPDSVSTRLGITGLYTVEDDIYDYISRTKPGKNGELQLTDALRLNAIEKEIFGFEIDGRRYDIGTMDMWLRYFVEFIEKDPRYSHILK